MKPSAPRRLGPAAVGITLVASLGACTDRSPTAPEPAAAEAAALIPAGDSLAAERAGLAAAVEDATSRLVPGLSDRGRAEPVGRALARLGAALAAGEAEQVERAVTMSRNALDAYAAGVADEPGADAPGLAAIRLVLDRLDGPEAK